MSPDKIAIEKLWEKHSYPKKNHIHYRLMDQESFKIALSEAEGERERLQTQIDDIADELGCTEKTSHRHSHGRCIFAAIENLRTEGERMNVEEERWMRYFEALQKSYPMNLLALSIAKEVHDLCTIPAPPKEKP